MTDNRKAAIEAVEKNRDIINEHWNNAKYTKSIVAFIDVMGTKDLILENPDSFNDHKTIYKTWHEIERRIHKPEYRARIGEIYGDYELKSTIMSDGIVLSISFDIPDAFSYLFMELGSFVNSLLSINPPHFSRGAVTIGNLYHEDNIVFGPALVEANLLEKNVAKNFRFIIRKKDFNEAGNIAGDDFKNFLVAYFTEETDGYCSFNYLYRFFGAIDNWIKNGGASEGYLNMLNRIQKKAKHEATYNKDIRVQEKYVWMENYFRTTLRQILLDSDDDDYIWLMEAYKEWQKN